MFPERSQRARGHPDGRYLVAMPANWLSLVVFDFQTQKWSRLGRASAAFPNWSRGGRYVYFLRWLDNPAVLRVRISDREVEQVTKLQKWLVSRGKSLLRSRNDGSQDSNR